MTKELYTITRKDLFDLFARLSERYSVFVPYRKEERLNFGPFDQKREEEIDLGGIRQSQPAKSFVSAPREIVAGPALTEPKPLVLAGVKSCDLQSFIVQDFVFRKGDLEDPLYAKRRDNTLIISSDCTYARETCFCLALAGFPYPDKNFDINLSAVKDFFIVEVGSEKGEKLLNDYKMFFKPSSREDAVARDLIRKNVSEQVKGFIDKRNTPDTTAIKGAIKKSYNLLELWQDSSSTCVECGACNLVCPTCHCFLLFDEKSASSSRAVERARIWDSCLYKTFARVAGGANPRRHLYERLRNRFDKKFEFFPEVLNHFACTGCGRCIEACPGDIDIREVLKGAVSGKWEKPPHK